MKLSSKQHKIEKEKLKDSIKYSQINCNRKFEAGIKNLLNYSKTII